ncbi:MAG: DUF5694 domain-containing protein [Bacteroidota bacterium]
MRTLVVAICISLIASSTTFGQDQTENTQPSIALLGMFHFGETSDLAAIKMDDLHGEKRQTQIKDLVAQLQEYQPTKILVEYPMSRKDTIQIRYEAYLNNAYKLGDSETYQIGFRLAKAMGHSNIYAMDHKMDLPFDDLAAHLGKTGEMDKMNSMVKMINEMIQGETNVLATLPLSTFLLRLNSDRFDALANSLYLKEVLDMGTPDNEVGARFSAIWYQRNMIMLKNIASYIESPNDRILVIVGSSHRAVIRDYIEDRNDLKYVEIAKFLR